ncbi:unnamed protein product [Phytomonas sp. EM1]|nr:unnamed protein product [Phytomonas sp. EM1]|eukprot:CCW63541.1 unnamed protein product [Phytomonas sp. isolate EM1]
MDYVYNFLRLKQKAHDGRKCTMVPERALFEKEKVIYESAHLKFKGVDGYDVYNCSVPFKIDGKFHILGRVERRPEWVNSHVRLFAKTGNDEYTLVPGSMIWQLEDPFVSKIQGEMVIGGTRIKKDKGTVSDYGTDFYRGSPNDLVYFTSGPEKMKDVRLVELQDGRIGIFSHHKFKKKCLTGFAIIDKLDDLSADAIDSASPIDHSAFGDAWGGVNQAYLLTSGKIGCISHHGYLADGENGTLINVYCATSFVYEVSTNKVYSYKIIGTKPCFPDCPVKAPRLVDCAFVSGIVMRDDGKCDLYSGLGDTCEGRIVIDYPFEGHGDIVDSLVF